MIGSYSIQIIIRNQILTLVFYCLLTYCDICIQFFYLFYIQTLYLSFGESCQLYCLFHRIYHILMIKEYDYLFKIVIIGNSSVGKSSLLRRFSDDQFQESYLATIGVDFRFKSLTVNGGEVKLQIWDTAGQERFRTITSAYYKGAHGIIMVYDLTAEQSFKDVQQFWAGEVQKFAQSNVVLALTGNKSDQTEGRFNNSGVLQYCTAKGIDHFQSSAKLGDGVQNVFKSLAQKLTKVHPKAQRKETPQSDVVSKVMQKKNEFKLKSGGLEKIPAKKKCC